MAEDMLGVQAWRGRDFIFGHWLFSVLLQEKSSKIYSSVPFLHGFKLVIYLLVNEAT
jgi:hypothetical protein